MSEMIVARKPCGCIGGAILSEADAEMETIIDYLREGCTVSMEERDTIGFERCDKHEILRLGNIEKE